MTSDGLIANVGDEALTVCLASRIASRNPGVRAVSTLNGPRHSSPDRVPIRPVRRLLREIRRSDVVVIGGGTLFQEEKLPRALEPTVGLLRYMSVVALLARLCRVPMVISSVGAESLRLRRSRLAAWAICRTAVAISARDAESAEVLEALCGKPVKVAADPLFLDGCLTGIRNVNGNSPEWAMALSLRNDASPELLGSLARIANERPGRVLLVSMDRESGQDELAFERFERLINDPRRCHVLAAGATWTEILEELSRAKVCLGMRLHFLIFASLVGRPLVPLTSLPKTLSFARDVGLEGVPADASFEQLAAALVGARPASSLALAALRNRAESAIVDVEELLG